MERFLLLWDEIDDLVGTSRYYVKNTAMAIWTLASARADPLLGPHRGLNSEFRRPQSAGAMTTTQYESNVQGNPGFPGRSP